MKTTQMVQRYTASERCNHWLVAISFILTTLSGLGFFHPGFYWLTNLFGGAVWARILHPYFAAFLVLSFLVWLFRLRHYLGITKEDRKWAGEISAIMRNKMDAAPPVGKFNFGQKMLSSAMFVLILLLLASGICIWQPWFADDFSVPTRRIAVVVHFLSASAVILAFIVHVYAAIWTSGSISGMVRGWVSKDWALAHSELWYKKMIEERKEARGGAGKVTEKTAAS